MPVNGSRIWRVAVGSRRAATRAGRAAAAIDERPSAIPSEQSGDDQQHGGHGVGSWRSARSATMRTSTPGSRSHQLLRQRGAQPREAARLARAAEQDVGRAALGARRARPSRRASSDSSTIRFAPSTEASVRSAESEDSCSAVSRLPGRLDPQDVELGAEPLGRAPGAPHEPLRARIGLDERHQPLADRLRRRVGDQLVVAACRRCSVTIRLASTSSATWRSATSRSAERFSIRKKLFSAASMRAGRVDLARAQAVEQRFGRDVDQHDLVGAAEHLVGDRLAHGHAGQLGDAVVERLEVLHVDGRDHVDPGVQDVLDVLVALVVLDAGDVRVRELVDQADLRRAAQDRRAGPSPRAAGRGTRRGGAEAARAPRRAPPSRRGRGTRAGRRRRRGRSPARHGPPAASGRSCRRRRPCRGRSCSGRVRRQAQPHARPRPPAGCG